MKFLDGAYQWDEKREVAGPAHFDPAADSSRILLHAGDLSSHPSGGEFRAGVLASRLQVIRDRVDYQWGPASNRIEVTRYDPGEPRRFALPLINGRPLDLRPPSTFQSPFLNGAAGDDLIRVSVGPVSRILDFSTTDPDPAEEDGKIP